MKKKRLDVELVARGLFESREKAQRAVLAGEIFSKGQRIDKPGTSVGEETELEYRGATDRYVSRGAYKLETALDTFELDPTGLDCLDIGSSTGGFTDCLLQRGASRVVCVDVGRGQLHWKLRQDDRVEVHEGVNARHLDADFAGEGRRFGIVVTDVSFISLRLILPLALDALADPALGILALIKPQFEAGRAKVGKGGIVRDEAVRQEVIADLQRWLAEQQGPWHTAGLVPSKITGQDGNQEYLWWIARGD